MAYSYLKVLYFFVSVKITKEQQSSRHYFTLYSIRYGLFLTCVSWLHISLSSLAFLHYFFFFVYGHFPIPNGLFEWEYTS